MLFLYEIVEDIQKAAATLKINFQGRSIKEAEDYYRKRKQFEKTIKSKYNGEYKSFFTLLDKFHNDPSQLFQSPNKDC